jgi:hypothetical protein
MVLFEWVEYRKEKGMKESSPQPNPKPLAQPNSPFPSPLPHPRALSLPLSFSSRVGRVPAQFPSAPAPFLLSLTDRSGPHVGAAFPSARARSPIPARPLPLSAGPRTSASSPTSFSPPRPLFPGAQRTPISPVTLSSRAQEPVGPPRHLQRAAQP